MRVRTVFRSPEFRFEFHARLARTLVRTNEDEGRDDLKPFGEERVEEEESDDFDR